MIGFWLFVFDLITSGFAIFNGRITKHNKITYLWLIIYPLLPIYWVVLFIVLSIWVVLIPFMVFLYFVFELPYKALNGTKEE